MKLNDLIPIFVKIKELALQLAKAIDVVTDSATIIQATPEEIVKVESNDSKPKEAIEVKPTPKKEYTLTDVRTVLASLSKNGYTNDVKALLRKYGGEKLSDIKPEDYEALMKDAEVLKNGK